MEEDQREVGSEFLKEHLRQEKYWQKVGINPKDKHGARLSLYWQPGDSILSVSLKKLHKTLSQIFNPDTYTLSSYRSLKRQLTMNKLDIYIALFIFGVPVMLATPFLLPKFKRVKREYLFQQFVKRRFYEEELSIPERRVSRRRVQEILEEANQRVNI